MGGESSERKEPWYINRQRFSTDPVAEHAERARQRVAAAVMEAIDVVRAFQSPSTSTGTSSGVLLASTVTAGSIALGSAPALPPCGSRFLPIGNRAWACP